MTILPAIDLIDGRCVRLSQGDYAQKKQYDASPVDMVRQYVAHGLHRVHVVDLDGANKVLKLIDALEEVDDIQNVYSNLDIPDEVATQLNAED